MLILLLRLSYYWTYFTRKLISPLPSLRWKRPCKSKYSCNIPTTPIWLQHPFNYNTHLITGPILQQNWFYYSPHRSESGLARQSARTIVPHHLFYCNAYLTTEPIFVPRLFYYSLDCGESGLAHQSTRVRSRQSQPFVIVAAMCLLTISPAPCVRELQYVLRWVAVSCSELQWVAVSCSELQWVAVSCGGVQWGTVCHLNTQVGLHQSTPFAMLRWCAFWL